MECSECGASIECGIPICWDCDDQDMDGFHCEMDAMRTERDAAIAERDALRVALRECSAGFAWAVRRYHELREHEGFVDNCDVMECWEAVRTYTSFDAALDACAGEEE